MKHTLTPLADADQKADLIEHVNNEHLAELRAIVQAHVTDVAADHAELEDVFEEGCLIRLGLAPDGTVIQRFVPFSIQGEIEEKVFYLAYEAMVRQGKPLSGGKKQYFEVEETFAVSPGMLRVVARSHAPLPLDSPGHAYFFSLRTLQKQPPKPAISASAMSGLFGRWGSQAMLWLIRQLSPRKRQKVLRSFSKELRYYTLRQARQRSSDGVWLADIDIFLHGDTPGSTWAQRLRSGAILASHGEYTEHCEHLQTGQAVLIADETGLPATASLLESWRNPLPPIVISITAAPADQAYLQEGAGPAGTMIHRLSSGPGLGDAILALLRTLPRIDTAWGALEHSDSRPIRKYLRDERQMNGKHNRLKGYWRRQAAAAGDQA